ncbi:uncharacterized protein LY79DRAFT_193636 [Colletotrichum navitas]|uniref:Uncharacterized protein n=1 Tax=Colletotrichum navitas TaxID=681940 RepID=A0AAD8PZA2_9PEZI|nr:uncharacterized protein LY79DRAFT_193636 [Colletotrichum navitas]KAK1590879.1 hypothetical protein LY79DRAFT_193636 [Colletotrichum navitas]
MRPGRLSHLLARSRTLGVNANRSGLNGRRRRKSAADQRGPQAPEGGAGGREEDQKWRGGGHKIPN